LRYIPGYPRAVLAATLTWEICFFGLEALLSPQRATHIELQISLSFFMLLALLFPILCLVTWIFACIPVAVSLHVAQKRGFHSNLYFALCGLFAGLLIMPAVLAIMRLVSIGLGLERADEIDLTHIHVFNPMILPFLAAGVVGGWVFGTHLNKAKSHRSLAQWSMPHSM
jgi:hypothetical protein